MGKIVLKFQDGTSVGVIVSGNHVDFECRSLRIMYPNAEIIRPDGTHVPKAAH